MLVSREAVADPEGQVAQHGHTVHEGFLAQAPEHRSRGEGPVPVVLTEPGGSVATDVEGGGDTVVERVGKPPEVRQQGPVGPAGRPVGDAGRRGDVLEVLRGELLPLHLEALFDVVFVAGADHAGDRMPFGERTVEVHPGLVGQLVHERGSGVGLSTHARGRTVDRGIVGPAPERQVVQSEADPTDDSLREGVGSESVPENADAPILGFPLLHHGDRVGVPGVEPTAVVVVDGLDGWDGQGVGPGAVDVVVCGSPVVDAPCEGDVGTQSDLGGRIVVQIDATVEPLVSLAGHDAFLRQRASRDVVAHAFAATPDGDLHAPHGGRVGDLGDPINVGPRLRVDDVGDIVPSGTVPGRQALVVDLRVLRGVQQVHRPPEVLGSVVGAEGDLRALDGATLRGDDDDAVGGAGPVDGRR